MAGMEWRWGRDSGWGGTGGGPGGLIPGIEAVDVGPEEDLHSIGILWVRPIHGFGGVEPGTGSAERGGIPVARLTSGPIGVSQSGALPEWLEAFGIGPVAGRSWERNYPSRLVGGHDATLRGGCFPVPTVDGGQMETRPAGANPPRRSSCNAKVSFLLILASGRTSLRPSATVSGI